MPPSSTKPPRNPIRIGVHHVTPMLQSIIRGAIALSDDIEIVPSEDPRVDVILLPETAHVLSLRSDVMFVSFCAQRPCSDVRNAGELAVAIRTAAGRPPQATLQQEARP